MRLFPVVILTALTLFSCKKEKSENQDESGCALRVKEIVKEELKCTTKESMEVNLYSGIYQNKTIYFTDVMCPNCGVLPPSIGYTCDGTKVSINDFANKVTQIKEVYNSCTQKFQ